MATFTPRCVPRLPPLEMNLRAEIQEIFELADQTDAVIESRYLRTGPKQRIETKALLAAVEAVRAKVKVSHEAAGVILAATQVLP